MLIEQIDNIRLESFEWRVSDFLNMLRPAVDTDRSPGFRVQFESKLCGDHHSLAKRSKACAHQFFVREWAINFGSVEKCDSAFHSGVNKRDHFLFGFRRPVPKAHSHATESDRRHLQSAISKFSFFHYSIC